MSRRIITITLLAVFAAIVFYPVGCHYQWQSETENYIAQLKAQGEMDPVKLLPPPVSPDQDGTDLFLQAIGKIDMQIAFRKVDIWMPQLLGMANVAPGKAMIRWQQPDIRYLNETDAWTDFSEAINPNTNAIDLLQQTREKPNINFQFDYKEWTQNRKLVWPTENESFKPIIPLNIAAYFNLHNGNTTEAIKDIETMLTLIQAQGSSSRFMIEQTRVSNSRIALCVTWEALQSPALTDQQLSTLQQSWMRLNFIEPMENALRMEQITGDISLHELRDSPIFASGPVSFSSESIADYKEAATFYLWKTWWSYRDELDYLKGLQIIVDTLHSAATEGAFHSALSEETKQLDKLGIAEFTPKGGYILGPSEMGPHWKFSSRLINLEMVPKNVLQIEVARNLVVAAIALKRYELKHGEWPMKLADLAPEFLPAVPKDPVDGQPLRYRKKDDESFLLYSIGSDGVDDGGNPASRDSAKRWYYWEAPDKYDWVWPQPASAKEVQGYFDHLHD